jgi:molybdopterin-guanine dinucleotide biosynthesis protein B
MKVFTIYGYTGSGKTTVAEKVIEALCKRGYSVGSIKEIHYENFKIDTPGTNTFRHKAHGADPVTARGHYETDIMYRKKLSIPEILTHYNQDYVVCEGVTDFTLPKILTAKSLEELKERWEEGIFAISGRIAEELGNKYNDVPVFNVLTEIDELTELIEKTVKKIEDKIDE